MRVHDCFTTDIFDLCLELCRKQFFDAILTALTRSKLTTALVTCIKRGVKKAGCRITGWSCGKNTILNKSIKNQPLLKDGSAIYQWYCFQFTFELNYY